MDSQPGTIWGREPAMVLALVQAVIALVVAFGLSLAGHLEDDVYLERLREIREAKDSVERTSGERIAAERATEWLRELSTTWTDADVPEAKADVLHAIYDQIVVTGREIMSVRLTPSAYAHGLALALPTKVALARPTGVERADAINIRIPIEGVEKTAELTA
jgi:hypothetical protein